jgi:hypothetical protein
MDPVNCSLPVEVPDVRIVGYIAVKIQVKVVWVLMLCSVVVGYHYFEGPWYCHLHGEVTGDGEK